MTVETLVDRLTTVARARPTAAALVLPRAGAGYRTVSYADLLGRVEGVSAGLAAAGIGGGARTVLMVPPGGEFFVLAFALLQAGAVPVLVDPGIGRRHLASCLAEAEPAAFIGVPRAHAARLALRWCPSVRRSVTVGPPLPGGGPTLRQLARIGVGRPPPSPVGPDVTAAVIFTSGSTGVPKGVEYRHPHFLAQLSALTELYRLGPQEVCLATFPPFALFGPPLGMTTVVPRMDPTRPVRVDAGRLVKTANRYRATVLFGSPALLDTVGRWAAAHPGAGMPSLRQVVSAGAPVGRDVIRRVLPLLPPGGAVHTPYGATEALPVTSIGSAELLSLAEPGVCVGRPWSGVEVTLVPVTDQPLDRVESVPPGEVGEIVVRGPVVTTSYLHRPEATARGTVAWDGVPAHRMGDLGSYDAAGRLWFRGRVTNRVVTAVGMLTTSPIEEVFNTHPAVRRSALVGVGPPAAQRAVLCAELEPWAVGSPVLTAALLALGATRPDTAAVREIRYHPGFPVDIRHNAKIDRAALAAWVVGSSPSEHPTDHEVDYRPTPPVSGFGQTTP